MSEKLRVGILGATGMVGQRFITLLADHPWFEIVSLAASPRSAGKTYEEAIGGRWKLDLPMPEKVKKMVVRNVNEVEAVASEVDMVFSAVDMTKDEIRAIEEAYAKTETPVVSNNSAHRWTPDVPMVVPEINPGHLDVIPYQKKRLGTEKGFIVVKPNCSIQSLSLIHISLPWFCSSVQDHRDPGTEIFLKTCNSGECLLYFCHWLAECGRTLSVLTLEGSS